MIATMIAHLYGNDGAVFERQVTRRIEADCRDHAMRVVTEGSTEKFLFRDGTAIIVGNWGWDLALNPDDPDCFCPEGVGHCSELCGSYQRQIAEAKS